MRILHLGSDGRLGMEGDAGAGEKQHAEIVGAIADGEGLAGECRAERKCRSAHRPWPCLPRIGRRRAGETSVLFQEEIGTVLIEAEGRGDRAGEDVEAAGDKRGVIALDFIVATVPGRPG